MGTRKPRRIHYPARMGKAKLALFVVKHRKTLRWIAIAAVAVGAYLIWQAM